MDEQSSFLTGLGESHASTNHGKHLNFCNTQGISLAVFCQRFGTFRIKQYEVSYTIFVCYVTVAGDSKKSTAQMVVRPRLPILAERYIVDCSVVKINNTILRSPILFEHLRDEVQFVLVQPILLCRAKFVPCG